MRFIGWLYAGDNEMVDEGNHNHDYLIMIM